MVPHLPSLTEAVADGREPDWSSLDLTSLSDEERRRVDQLRAVSDISRCLATFTADITRPGGDPGPMPATWGSLELRERVGRGRFGDVYRAWDPAIARPVALKLLRRDRDGPAADRVVVDEGRLMGRVRHPNVATIYGAAHHDGRTGLWMEFIEGRTLEAELRERGPLPAMEAAAIGVELCRALAAVHAAGLVHRDVKAQNVMRDTSGRVVLGDFGTGLDLDGQRAPGLAGTPVYLAPEIFSRQPATPQSDLYSLGVVLFRLVTGSFPVTGASIAEVRERHAQGMRLSIAEVAPSVPAAFREVVERALAPDPRDRFGDATDMAAALEAVIAPTPVPLTPTRRERRWATRAIAVSATGLVAAGLIGSVLWQRGVLSLSQPANPGTPAFAAAASQGPRLGRVDAPSGQFWGQPSPDGRLFTFVDMSGNLGVFDPRSGEQRILTDHRDSGAFAYESSTFSPDGLQIAYAWGAADGARELRIVPASGGPSRLVRQHPDEVAHPIEWSDAGQDILVRLERHDGTQQLALISVATGVLQRLDVVDASFGRASLSPDGRYVVFDSAQQPEATERDIFIRAVDREEPPRPLGSGPGDDFGPLWTPDGLRVLFVSDRTGEPSIWGVDVNSGQAPKSPVLLQRNIGRVTPYGLTDDGTLYYALQVGIVDVFTAGIDLQNARLETPRPIAPSQVGSKMNADWSRDGRLAYVLLPQAGSGANRTRRLVILDPSSGERRVLNPRLSYYAFPQWSRDERTLLVKGVDMQRRRGVYLIDAGTGEARPAALVGSATPQEIGAVAWGPDSRTILFARDTIGVVSLDLGTGREDLVFRYAAEGITRLTNGMALGLSPDGQALAYSAHRRTKDGKVETVLRLKPGAGPSRDLWVGNVLFDTWTPDGGILFTQYGADWQAQMMSLWNVSPDGGPPRSFGVEIHGLRNVRMHPDGRQVVLTSGFPGSDLWALEHFLAGRQ